MTFHKMHLEPWQILRLSRPVGIDNERGWQVGNSLQHSSCIVFFCRNDETEITHNTDLGTAES